MQIIKTGETKTAFGDAEFRVLVVDESPCCKVKEAHVIEWLSGAKCAVCGHEIELPVSEKPEPVTITVWAERRAHTAECVRCSTAGQTGRSCDKGLEYFSRINKHVSRRETPYMVKRVQEFSTGYVEVRRTGHWTEREAIAWANVQGGDVIDQTDKFVVQD